MNGLSLSMLSSSTMIAPVLLASSFASAILLLGTPLRLGSRILTWAVGPRVACPRRRSPLTSIIGCLPSARLGSGCAASRVVLDTGFPVLAAQIAEVCHRRSHLSTGATKPPLVLLLVVRH